MRLSGESFVVVYRLVGSLDECRATADDICVEQTIEFPLDLVWKEEISRQIVAEVARFREVGRGVFLADIRYSAEVAGADLPQLLTVMFGNFSLKPGVRVERLELPDSMAGRFNGPRFGRLGLRRLLGVENRALLCSAVKPMGLSPRELADLAYRFALGGMDMVKDDHGLADQPFCPFKERVLRCAESVDKANRETGGRCLYMPNITGAADSLFERARFARQAGAGGLLVAPGLVGLSTMRVLADDDSIALPVVAHPALQGSFVVHPDQGISHFALFGQLDRLAGADAVIFPNYGGRFSFSLADCRELTAGTQAPLGSLRSSFPVPAGGMSVGRVPELLEFFGNDVILLIGGDLHRHPGGLVKACREFRGLV